MSVSHFRFLFLSLSLYRLHLSSAPEVHDEPGRTEVSEIADKASQKSDAVMPPLPTAAAPRRR